MDALTTASFDLEMGKQECEQQVNVGTNKMREPSACKRASHSKENFGISEIKTNPH